MRQATRMCVLAAGLVLLAATNLFAANGTVGDCFVNGGGNGYTTIQSAVISVTPNATVYVCPGTYQEQVTISQPLRVIGVQVVGGTADGPTVLPPTAGLTTNATDIYGNPVQAQIFVNNVTGSVTIEKLTVDATGNNVSGCGTDIQGIYYQNSSGTITENVVRNQYQTDYTDYGGCQGGLAINVESATSTHTVTVSNNYVSAYQKNGITASGAATGPGSPGPAVTIQNNYIVGLAATAQNWPTSGAAENGIQVGFGATGKVETNIVSDNIWAQDTSSQPYNAASGILIYASTGISVTGNTVTSAQFGITTNTDPTYGPGDSTTITGNKVAGTQIFDGIDACSSLNTVGSNNVYGSAESGIHLDDSCGSGDSNSVTKNTINGACAGILLGTGTGNTLTSNTIVNTTNTTMSGDQCPAPVGDAIRPAVAGARRSLRPSPYMPVRK